MVIVLVALLAFAASPAAAASVLLEPASGPPGAAATVSGSDLPAYSTIELRIAGATPQVLVADGEGRLQGSAQIPARARGNVPVALRTGDGSRATLTYRVASPFASKRSAETSDWQGRLMRVTTSLDIGELATTVELSGLDATEKVSVTYNGRRVARTSGAGATRLDLRLPGRSAGLPLRARAGEVRLAAPLQAPPAVLAAVGDIACRPGSKVTAITCRHAETALTAASFRPDVAALLGDIQYEGGRLTEFQRSFDPTWGQLEMPLRPVLGNHEYRTEGAPGYFDYFEERTRWRPPNWYSYNLGTWHIVALNSNCDREGVPCEADGEQAAWLAADLAANPRRCTLAYWHHPRYSSGFHGSDVRTSPFWRVLQRAGAEVVVAGHDHDYERFAPQNATGQADPNGMRSFVAGTGGKNTTPLYDVRAPHSQFGLDNALGVMIFRLYDEAYSWRFVRIDGKVLDFGNDSCH